MEGNSYSIFIYALKGIFYCLLATLAMLLLFPPSGINFLDLAISLTFLFATIGLFFVFIFPMRYLRSFVEGVTAFDWVFAVTAFRLAQHLAVSRAFFEGGSGIVSQLINSIPSLWTAAGYITLFAITHFLAFKQVNTVIKEEGGDPVLKEMLADGMRQATKGTFVGVLLVCVNIIFNFIFAMNDVGLSFEQALFFSYPPALATGLIWYFPLLAKVLRISFAARRIVV